MSLSVEKNMALSRCSACRHGNIAASSLASSMAVSCLGHTAHRVQVIVYARPLVAVLKESSRTAIWIVVPESVSKAFRAPHPALPCRPCSSLSTAATPLQFPMPDGCMASEGVRSHLPSPAGRPAYCGRAGPAAYSAAALPEFGCCCSCLSEVVLQAAARSRPCWRCAAAPPHRPAARNTTGLKSSARLVSCAPGFLQDVIISLYFIAPGSFSCTTRPPVSAVAV